jgi:hypothetical protein
MTPNTDAECHDNTLHDLFDAATADLPPLPDLAPEAHRIVHRRRLATRSLGAALSAALAVGAGTFALDSLWRSGGATGFSLQVVSPERDFKIRAAALLQSVWPVRGETIKPAAGRDPGAFMVLVPGDRVVYQLFLSTSATSSQGAGCDPVEHTILPAPNGTNPIASVNCYRSNVEVMLLIFGTPASLISDAQQRTLESTLLAPGLIEWAIADGVVAQSLPTSAPPTPSVSTPRTGTPTSPPSVSRP